MGGGRRAGAAGASTTVADGSAFTSDFAPTLRAISATASSTSVSSKGSSRDPARYPPGPPRRRQRNGAVSVPHRPFFCTTHTEHRPPAFPPSAPRPRAAAPVFPAFPETTSRSFAGVGDWKGVGGGTLGNAPTELASQKDRSRSISVCDGVRSSAREGPHRCGKSPAPPNARLVVALASLAARSSSVSSVFRASRVVFASATGPRPLGPGRTPTPDSMGSPRAPSNGEPEDTPDAGVPSRLVCADVPELSRPSARAAPPTKPPKLPTAPVAAAARLAPVGGTVPGAPGISPAT